MRKIHIGLLLIVVAIAVSCNKATAKLDDPHQGNISLAVDESFLSVAEALTDRYMALYPDAKINLEVKKEDLALLDLLDKKVRVIVMSRELNEKEELAFKEKVREEIQTAKFAADAVVFIVPKNSTRESISLEEIKTELKSDKKNIIFDGTNSSNLNFVAQKIGTSPQDLKFSIISGNKNVLQEISKYPNKIGVISLNTISRPYNEEMIKLKESIKILPVISNGKSYQPELENLRDMSYPFTRVLYFLTNENYYGLGNGFIRFSCQNLGQIIVEKEGLQPYNIFKREVQMR